MLKNDDMPPPDAMIEYSDGMVGAAMFHYTSEGCDLESIATEHGFSIRFTWMVNDRDAEELNKDYEDGFSDTCARWHPAVQNGWQLAAKNDTEDGPVAAFIRKKPTQGG